MHSIATRKPGSNSYSPQPKGSTLRQTTTVPAPEIIPASAPGQVILRQYSDSRMIGPNDAPKPAQAYSTSPSTDSAPNASTYAMAATSTTVARPTHSRVRSDAARCRNAL